MANFQHILWLINIEYVTHFQSLQLSTIDIPSNSIYLIKLLVKFLFKNFYLPLQHQLYQIALSSRVHYLVLFRYRSKLLFQICNYMLFLASMNILMFFTAFLLHSCTFSNIYEFSTPVFKSSVNQTVFLVCTFSCIQSSEGVPSKLISQ